MGLFLAGACVFGAGLVSGAGGLVILVVWLLGGFAKPRPWRRGL